ncbi:hypothetical protein ACFQLX_17350 [Streptomyces polyrhachis]|uniref:Uncharacterized protein n=1 Tax=Streptomyces polyrhachis TaxID=1282885 RepID=A0ABW2GJN8_9ACTN
MLERCWYVSGRVGHEVGLTTTAADYVATVLTPGS